MDSKNKLITRRITRGLRPLGCQPLRGRHPCALRYVLQLAAPRLRQKWLN